MELDYKLIFNKLSDSVFIHNFDMKILEVNSAACIRLGYSREQMLNMYISDIDSPEFSKFIPDRMAAMEKHGELIFQSAQITSTGHLIPVEIHSSIIEIDNKPSILSIARDISEQNSLLTTAIEALPHPFYMVNIENYEILFANSATSKFRKWQGSTCYKTTHNINAPCNGEEHGCPIKKIRKTGKPVVLEHIIHDDFGNTRYIEVHGYPVFNKEGKFTRMIEYSLDITEKKSMVSKLESEKQRAENADKLKSQFLANMSHEIRTPLNSIIGFIELTIGNEDLKDKYKEYLGYSLESGKSLLALINDILDLSKIEAGQIEIEDIPFSLNILMESVLSSSRVLLSEKKKNIDIRFSKSENINYEITGDPHRLEQILNNLMSNAIKFTSIGFIEYGVSLLDEKTLEFYVRDSGLGIESNKIERLFLPFTQSDSSTTRKYGGTGLGLTITKQLIELMGGNIRIKSQKGEGSSFYFTMPYKPIQGSIIKKAKNPIIKRKDDCTHIKNILIAEDEISNQKLLEHILLENGYSILLAQDGRDAISIYKTTPSIDLLVMDINMPHLSGMEAVRVIRNIEKTNHKKRIPIIAITAFAMKGDNEQCMEAGFDEYLTKPLDQKLLLKTLEKYF